MSDKNDTKYSGKYRLKIRSCTSPVQRIKLVEATRLALQTTIETNHQVFRYPLCHVKMKYELLTFGSSNFEFDNQCFGHIPNRLTMCTVENRSMYGVFKENPFHFKHNNLESLTVSLDNDTLIRLDFHFDNGNYVEAYNTLKAIFSTRQNFPRGATFSLFKDQLVESGHQKTKENITPRRKFLLVGNSSYAFYRTI